MRYKSKLMSIKTVILLCLAFPVAFAASCGSDSQPGDDDPPEEEFTCEQVDGPPYWGCLPPDFEAPAYGERCSLEEGFTFCFDQSPCICYSLTCHEGTWKDMSARDISCGNSCDLARFGPDDPRGDMDCDS